MNRLKLLSVIALFCVAVQTTHAQIVSWNFAPLTTADNTTDPLPVTSSSPNVTIVGLSRGPGATVPNQPQPSTWGASGFLDAVAAASQTAATAASNGNYIYFSITPNAGFSASLSSISPHNLRKGFLSPTNSMWQYSVDGTNFTDLETTFAIGGTTNSNGFDHPEIILTGQSALQNIPAGTTVTFRLLAWNSSLQTGILFLNGGGANAANRALTINGTTTPSAPLPLQLISFNGKQQKNTNHLEWITAQEKDVFFYELEKGTDGRTFNKIATINATGNDNNGNNHYAYDDADVTTTAYYRLRMVDRDGKATQSNVVFLSKNAANTAIKVYPNPADNLLSIEGLNQHASYRILDVMGKEVMAATTVTGENNIATVNVEGLAKGDYFIQISGNNNNETIRFVKK